MINIDYCNRLSTIQRSQDWGCSSLTPYQTIFTFLVVIIITLFILFIGPRVKFTSKLLKYILSQSLQHLINVMFLVVIFISIVASIKHFQYSINIWFFIVLIPVIFFILILKKSVYSTILIIIRLLLLTTRFVFFLIILLIETLITYYYLGNINFYLELILIPSAFFITVFLSKASLFYNGAYFGTREHKEQDSSLYYISVILAIVSVLVTLLTLYIIQRM